MHKQHKYRLREGIVDIIIIKEDNKSNPKLQ